MELRQNLVFEGRLPGSVDRETVVDRLVDSGQLSHAEASAVINARGTYLLRSGIDPFTARRLRRIFGDAGLTTSIEPADGGRVRLGSFSQGSETSGADATTKRPIQKTRSSPERWQDDDSDLNDLEPSSDLAWLTPW